MHFSLALLHVAAILVTQAKELTMQTPYFTLLVRRNGNWEIEFGSFVRSEVTYELQEATDANRRKDLRIVQTGPAQADIDRAVRQLNAMHIA
jgi:hypothetical protein